MRSSFRVACRSTLLVIAVHASGATLSAQTSQPVDRVTGWRSDIAWWLDQVRAQHYVYRSKPLPAPLVKAAAALSRNVPQYSDDRMQFEMQRLAAFVGDGHTYIIPVGRNTFSAAQNFIAQIDKRTRAVFVGEPSSSKPNFVGEENEVVLPWSGAVGSISNRYHENIPGDTRPWIPIDIPVELSSADYFGGKDPVLTAALDAIRSGSHRRGRW